MQSLTDIQPVRRLPFNPYEYHHVSHLKASADVEVKGTLDIQDEAFRMYRERERAKDATKRLNKISEMLPSTLRAARSKYPVPSSILTALEDTKVNRRGSRSSATLSSLAGAGQGSGPDELLVRPVAIWLSDSRTTRDQHNIDQHVTDYEKATYAQRCIRREEERMVSKRVQNTRELLRVDDRLDLKPGSHLRMKSKPKKEKPKPEDDESGGSRKALPMEVDRPSQEEEKRKREAEEDLDLKVAIEKFDAFMASRWLV